MIGRYRLLTTVSTAFNLYRLAAFKLMRKMRNLQNVHPSEMVLTAGVREGSAETAENAANAAISEVHFPVKCCCCCCDKQVLQH